MEKVNKENKTILNEESREEKFVERYFNKSRKIVSKYLQELDSLPGAPNEFEYFLNILKKVFIDNELIRYKENEKFVTTYCTMFPQEIIRAAGARPLVMCSTSFVGTGMLGGSLPIAICPLVRALSENAKLGLNSAINSSDMFIVPLSCDCKKILAEELKISKPTFKITIPFNRLDDDGLALYVKQLKIIGEQISNITGLKITRKSLAREIKLYGDAQREIEIFNELRASDEILIRGSHALIVMNALAYDDLSNWLLHLKKLNEELRLKKEQKLFLTKKKMPRILLLGSSLAFPNIKVPLIIETEGGIVVSNYTCLGDKPHDDYVSISHDTLDGYYRGLANRSVKACACPTFPNNDVTINKIKEIINTKYIDGIVYMMYQGCITGANEFEAINNSLKETNVKLLKIETDLFSEDVELIKIRIGAFIEMLSYAKH